MVEFVHSASQLVLITFAISNIGLNQVSFVFLVRVVSGAAEFV